MRSVAVQLSPRRTKAKCHDASHAALLLRSGNTFDLLLHRLLSVRTSSDFDAGGDSSCAVFHKRARCNA